MKEMAQLKKYIAGSKNLSEPVNYFFDLMDKDDTNYFIKNRLVKDPKKISALSFFLEMVLKKIKDILKRDVKIITEMFHEIAEEKFYHGSCFITGLNMPMLILLCQDIQIGLVAFTGEDGHTNFLRFSFALENFESKH